MTQREQFLMPACMIGIRPGASGIEIFAPLGLDDIFDRVIRRNPLWQGPPRAIPGPGEALHARLAVCPLDHGGTRVTLRWFELLLAFTAAVASATSPLPPPMRLIPVDEAARDPSFVQFRNELKAVIARKDAAKLFHFLASDIHLSFGGDTGGPDFHKMWKPFDKDTQVWKALSLIVGNGGKFIAPGGFAAPYAYAAFPEDIDAFSYVVVTNPLAVLREKPDANARVIRKLDHDLLEVLNSSGKMQHEAGPNDWDEVKHASGQRGYVLSADVRSPVEYRAIFEKRKGKWVMQTLVAGD